MKEDLKELGYIYGGDKSGAGESVAAQVLPPLPHFGYVLHVL